MGEVIGIREDSIFSHGEPSAELVRLLTQLLADAESGSLRAISYVGITNERAINTNWCGHCDKHDMIAGVGMLSHRLLTHNDLDNG